LKNGRVFYAFAEGNARQALAPAVWWCPSLPQIETKLPTAAQLDQQLASARFLFNWQ